MTALSLSAHDSAQEETRNLRQIRQQLNDTCVESEALPDIPATPDPPCLVQIYPPTATAGRRYPIIGESVATTSSSVSPCSSTRWITRVMSGSPARS